MTPPEYVADHSEDLVELALSLLAVDTSNPPGDTTELVDSLESYLSGVDAAVERFATDPTKPNLLVTVPGRGDRTLLFNGHLDTVPYDEAEWTHDPLGELVEGASEGGPGDSTDGPAGEGGSGSSTDEPAREGRPGDSPDGPSDQDRIYGRGATDMKGALAAMAFVVEAFDATGTTPAVDLHFAFVSDEEVAGDPGLPALLSADRIDADACVIGEPTCEGGRHSVTVADRGSIWLTLEATGEAAHGSRPMLGKNAIDRLYAAVGELRDRFGDRDLPVDPDLQPVVEESVAFYEPTMGRETARRLFERPTMNLGTVHGGEAVNSVPESATAEIDVRLTARVDTAEVLADVRDCVSACDGVTVADVSWSVGTAEPVDSPLVESVASLAGDVVDERIYRRSATGGGDAKTLRNEGIRTVEFAFGTDTAHAADEYLPVEALVANAEVYARLPSRWVEAVAQSG